MVKKIYEAPNTIVSDLCVFVNGKPRRINFYPISVYEGSHTGRGSMFQTYSEEIQNALEASTMFGRQIFLFRVEKDEDDIDANGASERQQEEKKKEDNNLTVVPRNEVGSPNDAREYLEKHFGIEKKKVPNSKAIARAASENGIVFEALN